MYRKETNFALNYVLKEFARTLSLSLLCVPPFGARALLYERARERNFANRALRPNARACVSFFFSLPPAQFSTSRGSNARYTRGVGGRARVCGYRARRNRSLRY